ncbi:MAG: hypothetical protein AAF443_07255 [Chlamydiota bacterium]
MSIWRKEVIEPKSSNFTVTSDFCKNLYLVDPKKPKNAVDYQVFNSHFGGLKLQENGDATVIFFRVVA